jgi:hypothetical protein
MVSRRGMRTAVAWRTLHHQCGDGLCASVQLEARFGCRISKRQVHCNEAVKRQFKHASLGSLSENWHDSRALTFAVFGKGHQVPREGFEVGDVQGDRVVRVIH